MASSNVIIAEGALKRLNDILEGYKKPLIVSDVVIYDKYGQMIESIVDADVMWSISPDHRKGLVSRYHDIDVIVGAIQRNARSQVLYLQILA